MIRIDLIPKQRTNDNRARHVRAFVASCVFHGTLLVLLLCIAFYLQPNLPPLRNGSAPGAPSITLSTMVIVSPPPAPPAPVTPTPPPPVVPPTPPPPQITSTPPPKPETAPAPPDLGVPVLAVPPVKPTSPEPEKTEPAKSTHPTDFHPVATTAPSHAKPTAAAAPSSYSPGASDLPHPPYPTEARDRRQTGTVIMNVEFDAQGGVAQARIAQSSGVSILDTSTRSFIRAHWHSPAYAGQTVSVPVQYTLENL